MRDRPNLGINVAPYLYALPKKLEESKDFDSSDDGPSGKQSRKTG
jgi:hypothetical protein